MTDWNRSFVELVLSLIQPNDFILISSNGNLEMQHSAKFKGYKQWVTDIWAGLRASNVVTTTSMTDRGEPGIRIAIRTRQSVPYDPQHRSYDACPISEMLCVCTRPSNHPLSSLSGQEISKISITMKCCPDCTTKGRSRHCASYKGLYQHFSPLDIP